MYYDLSKTDTAIAYKLLAATVVPRPIAWTVTRSKSGQLNAAPFSFFNVMGSAPPTVALGILRDPEKGKKDTANNILETGEFVINLVPMSLVGSMNETAVNAPADISEIELAGLSTTPSIHVTPPRISASPVAFECVTHTFLETGPNQILVVGRVVAIHIADEFMKDPVRGHVDTLKLDLVARTFGAGYVRMGEPFDLTRPTWKDKS
jgi:flavin reductase (DIM6/NTAB) family NADH-FMN oxidoreductase RutF